MRGNVSKSIVSNIVNMDIPESGFAAPIVGEASGENAIRVNDSTEAPLVSVKLCGKTKQIQTAGKNMIPFPFGNRDAKEYYDAGYSTTVNGITFLVNEDGSVSFWGTATDDARFRIAQDYGYTERTHLPPGTYIINAYNSECYTNTFSISLAYKHTNKSVSLTALDYNTALKTFTIGDAITDAYWVAVDIVVKKGYRTNYETVYPMLEKSDVASGYEPYTNMMFSPSPDVRQPMNSAGNNGYTGLCFTGKNLIPFPYPNLFINSGKPNSDGMLKGLKVTEFNDGSFHIAGTASSNVYLCAIAAIDEKTFPAGTYTLSSFKGVGGGDTFRCSVSETAKGVDGKFSSGKRRIVGYDSGNGVTFTAKENYIYDIIFTVYSGATVDLTVKPQLEKGTQVTEYEPYKCQTISVPTPNGLPGVPVSSEGNYTDENGQQWVCDEIDFAKGLYIQRIGEYTLRLEDVSLCTRDYDFTKDQAPLWCEIPAEKIPFALSRKYCGGYGGGLWDRGIYSSSVASGQVATGVSEFCTSDFHYIAEHHLESPMIWLHMNAEDEELLNISTKYEGSKMLLIREEPEEISLPAEVLAEYEYLRTYKPVTTISNDGGAHMEIKYIADTKSYIDNKFADLESAIISTGGNV